MGSNFKKEKKMNYIDLFSGAGGMTLGFEEQNFENVFSVEYEKEYAMTYKQNFPNHNILVRDIRNIKNSEVKKLTNGLDVDVVIGGPPCQGFSMAGNIGRSFLEDERNDLFKEFLRFVDIIKPKMFVMENVSRMVSHDKGKTIQKIKESFEGVGYSVQYKVLQTEKYGIPQKRQRMIMVGTTGQHFDYPQEIEDRMTVIEAIGDLEELKNGGKSQIDPNHFAMNHTQSMLEKMAYISDGGTREQIPENLRPRSGDSRKYIKYDSSKPSVTVTGDMRKIFHYSQNRALTPRELARLQTFPDTFLFKGKSISIQQQIGNAVPPRLSAAIAKEVRKSLESN